MTADGETAYPPVPPTRDADAAAAVNKVRSLLEAAPERIGPYRLLEHLGGGGMGEVYVAEQTTPIKRRVAVKLIKPGMDSRQVVARFEAERQALAMMDHPNVAKVFDAGTTDSGRPYFVMELIRGVPLTQYCDDNKLTTRQRVELMVPVCQAVQHAHQKGIIHRDLKPTNVLVTLHDGKPVPKVIDFGIAKATGQSLTDKTVYTEFRQMIGTPAYMSPEQAEMSGLDIDTRSDVYSLGVLAYELLTGSTPFDTGRLVKAGLAEIGRIIKEEDPPRPSLRLSTMAEASRTTVATRRGTEPTRIGKLVAGELDWIVMKAMEKDRRRRYETANDLAADLGRHLNGEPVMAAAPTWRYRSRKLLAKHRGAVLAGATISVLVGCGLVGTTWGMLQAKRAKAVLQAEAIATQHALQHVMGENILTAYPGVLESNPRQMVVETMQTRDGKEYNWSYDFRASGDVTKGEFTVTTPDGQIASVPTVSSVIADIAVRSMRHEREARDLLVQQRDAAETEAYIANLALAQAAMQADRWPEARQRLDACPESKRGWEWRFLVRRAATVVKTIPAFESSLNRDRTLLLALGGDHVGYQSVRLWTPKGRAIGAEITGSRSDRLSSAMFSPDGRHILVDWGTYAQLYDLNGAAIGKSMPHAYGAQNYANFTADSKSVVTQEFRGKAKRWNLSGELQETVSDPESLQLSSENNEFYGKSMWNGEHIALSKDMKICVSQTSDSYLISLYDRSGRKVGVIRTNASGVLFRDRLGTPVLVPINPDRGFQLRGVVDIVDLTDANSPNEVITDHRVASLEQDTISNSTSGDSVPPDVRTKLERIKRDMPSPVSDRSSAISPDRQRFVIAGDDSFVRFYDVENGREMTSIRTTSAALGLRFTPDGTRLILDFADGTMEIWDTRDYAARQKDRDARFDEIPAARAYVQALLASNAAAAPSADKDALKAAIRRDASISTLRKLVAIEQLDLELAKRRAAARPAGTQPATRPAD